MRDGCVPKIHNTPCSLKHCVGTSQAESLHKKSFGPPRHQEILSETKVAYRMGPPVM